jgi:predicted protein tyrosine phosphatase
MIESVIVTDLSKAVDMPFKSEIKQDLWLSTVDPEDKNKVDKMRLRFKRKGIPSFAQYFRDWSDEDEEPYIKNNINEQGPQEQHINNIISFLVPLSDRPSVYHLGINCFAGISRSTALAIIVWVMQGNTPEEALRLTLNVRPQAWPNLRMLGFASKRLGVDVFTPVKEWKSERSNRLFTT